MERKMSPRSLASVFAALVSGGVASCGTADAVGTASWPLLEDRLMTLEARSGNSFATVEIRVADGADPNAVALLEVVRGACVQQILPRFAAPTPELAEPCGLNAGYEQQVNLCAAHQYLAFAEGIAPTDIFVLPQGENNPSPMVTLRVRRPGDSIADDPALGQRVMTVPVQSASGSGSAAMASAFLAQQALMWGAAALDEPTCPEGALETTLPSLDGTGTHLSFVIASATNEAGLLAVEAAEKTERFVVAAGTARMADDADESRARILGWRGRNDSRLEAVEVWLGVPSTAFEPDGSEPGALLDAGPLFPVVERRMHSPSLRRAEELLRVTRVDPRVDHDAEYIVEQSVRSALAADAPDVFGEIEDFELSDEAFFERLGTTPSDLRLAARSLVEESAVLGRPILVVPSTGPGGGGPTRVIGTAPRHFVPEPSFLVANSTGRTTLAEGANNNHQPPIGSYAPAPGGSDVPRGVVQTLDLSRTIVDQALRGRGDLDPSAVGILDIFTGYVHDNVPLRARVCVGPASMGAPQQQARIRLYGVDPAITVAEAATRYSIWVGERGLRCALTGKEEPADPGQPLQDCDPTRYRVTTTPTILSAAAVERSGLGPRAVEWDITVAGGGFPAPEYLSGVPAGTNLYVLTRAPETDAFRPEEDSSDPARMVRHQWRALTGFRIDAGTAGGTFSRCTTFPIGGLVDDVVRRILSADTNDPTDPATHCAGVPRNIELPLEDEITEAGTSSQVAEQVFLHYLDRARDAAARAENLGERLISEQVELQNLAEGAVQRLNQICGTNVSAGHVPEESLLPACDSDADCPPGNSCRALPGSPAPGHSGRCMRGSLVDYLTGDEADLTRLRRCLGDDGGLATATLGQEPVCGWYSAEGVLCGCPAGSEAACSAAQCMTPGRDCSERQAMLPPALQRFQSIPLAMVAREVPGIAPPATCSEIAALRSLRVGSSLARLVQRDAAHRTISASGWFSQAAFQRVGSGLALRGDIGVHATVTRGGRPWLQTGSFLAGSADTFPCAPHPDLPPSDVAQYCDSGLVASGGASLLCGGDCSTSAGRSEIIARLDGALRGLARTGGSRIRSAPVPALYTPVPFGGIPYTTTILIPPWISGGLLGGAGGVVRYGTIPGTDPAATGTVVRCLTPDPGAPPLPTGFAPCGPTWELTGYHFPELEYRDAGTAELGREASLLWVPVARSAPRGYMRGLLDEMRDDVVEGGARGRSGERVETELDAIELACLAQSGDVGGCTIDPGEPPQVRSIEDMARLEQQLRCAGDRFAYIAEQLVFPDMPADVAADLRAASISGTYPRYAGEYGVAVATLRGQMERIVQATAGVSGVIGQFALDVAAARSRERVFDNELEIIGLQQQANMFNQIFGCLASAAPSVSGGLNAGVSYNTGAIFTCINAGLQVWIGDQVANLERETSEESRLQSQLGLSSAFSDRSEQLSQHTSALAEAFSTINATLATMANLRREGRSNIARMLLLDSDEVGQEIAYHADLRGRVSRTREQYEEAHRNAIRMAFLARLAIEQRLGFDLNDFEQDMTLVDSPARWADSVCTLNGVDFNEVWRDPDTGLPPRDAEDAAPHGIRTVADYVERLRLLLDSYLLDYPFGNAYDTTVLSLDDDLIRPRVPCDITGQNLILDSEDLANSDEDAAEWVMDCAEGDACPIVTRDDRPDGPFLTVFPSDGVATRALGGGSAFSFLVSCDASAGGCGGPNGFGGGWGQYVALEPGQYIVSWYERVAAGGFGVRVVSPAGAPAAAVAPLAVVPAEADRWIRNATNIPMLPAGSAWQRVQATITVAEGTPADDPYLVSFFVASGSDYPSSTTIQGSFAAPQLELRSSRETFPTSYFPTDENGLAPVGLCADNTGAALRSQFVRRCEPICATGIGCTEGGTTELCFWEADFGIALGEIETGRLFSSGGFAVGNFNYRIDSLAVNLVGTNLRDCSRVSDPSGCYSNGNIPYSILHDSGFTVRNHDGVEHEVAIFPGRIVSARALAAERSLTNPLSSADRALLTDYNRTEFRGRPLNGSYRIRIHETPGLAWENVEDIQIVLNYRYWTRQE